MTLVGLLNDLQGDMTFAEARDRLHELYTRLMVDGKGDLAGLVMRLHNEVSGYIDTSGNVADVWDAGGTHGVYHPDHELPDFLRVKLTQLSDALEAARVPGADLIDPNAEQSAIDAIGETLGNTYAAAGLGALAALVLGVVLWFVLK